MGLWPKLDCSFCRECREENRRLWAAFWARAQAWDYAQANDDEIRKAYPDQDEVHAATHQLDDDPEAAFQTLLRHAQSGSAWSMLWVGWCFVAGRGTAMDRGAAEAWYRRAYESGCQHALIDLCQLLASRDEIREREALLAAEAARGWAPALYRLAQLWMKNKPTPQQRIQARTMLERAAAIGSPGARVVLASRLAKGQFGLLRIPAALPLLRASLKADFDWSRSHRETALVHATAQ